MRTKGAVIHSLGDRLIRADFNMLSDDDLKIALQADSPSSADKSCDTQKIYGQKRIQIYAVAQILRDYPEHVLYNYYCLIEIDRLMTLICSLPDITRNEVITRLQKNLTNKHLNW